MIIWRKQVAQYMKHFNPYNNSIILISSATVACMTFTIEKKNVVNFVNNMYPFKLKSQTNC